MYVIRFEKESLNDYMIYEIDNDPIVFLCDNNFEIAYPNDNFLKMRIHFKVIVYNKNIHYYLYNILDFLNNKFNSTYANWSVVYNEKVIDNKHIIQLFFYSNKYYTTLEELKKIVDCLYESEIIFDDSIYYRKHKKYSFFISNEMVNQTYSKKNMYKLLFGEIFNLNILDITNLIYYKIVT